MMRTACSARRGCGTGSSTCCSKFIAWTRSSVGAPATLHSRGWCPTPTPTPPGPRSGPLPTWRAWRRPTRATRARGGRGDGTSTSMRPGWRWTWPLKRTCICASASAGSAVARTYMEPCTRSRPRASWRGSLRRGKSACSSTTPCSSAASAATCCPPRCLCTPPSPCPSGRRTSGRRGSGPWWPREAGAPAWILWSSSWPCGPAPPWGTCSIFRPTSPRPSGSTGPPSTRCPSQGGTVRCGSSPTRAPRGRSRRGPTSKSSREGACTWIRSRPSGTRAPRWQNRCGCCARRCGTRGGPCTTRGWWHGTRSPGSPRARRPYSRTASVTTRTATFRTWRGTWRGRRGRPGWGSWGAALSAPTSAAVTGCCGSPRP
mmetsp:Transcript_51536/g.164825  ORF Transcript_51536/g.164825 Transcript_51536/m.164825 type:complete len:373 (-) Transcript_51536:152-1270(-)